MQTLFEILSTPLADLKLVRRIASVDSRGYFERMFCEHDLFPLLQAKPILQINRTFTTRPGTIRGMHFQHPPYAETKVVSCLHGKVFDVAVDLRRKSPTFLRWHAEILSGTNRHTLVIPEGFAHGFQALSENCEMMYLHTAVYNLVSESGLNALDPRLAISWPQAVSDISPKDAAILFLPVDFSGIDL